MGRSTSSRRFVIVGEPFYVVDGFHFDDVEGVSAGELVTSTDRPDEDGDLVVYGPNGSDAVNLGCLVEVDEDGYPILPADADELTIALAPLAIVVLGGAL